MIVLGGELGTAGEALADGVRESLNRYAQPTVAAALEALTALSPWTTADIEAALRASLVDGLGLKPKHAFGPIRVAVTGRTVSPPLFESMELLGREKSLARLGKALNSIE
jgi:glutamyl-tRNA synthetase